MKKIAAVAGLPALLAAKMASATGPTLDVSAATGVLSGTVQDGIIAVGVVIFTLAAVAMGVSWVKATFFG